MEKKNNKVTKQDKQEQKAINTIMTINANKNALEFKSAMDNLLDISKIQTIQDADLFIATTQAISDKVLFKRAKVLQKVAINELWKKSDRKFKSFEEYCSKMYGIEKTQAYNSVHIAQLITDDGTQSILPHAKNFDYTTTKLLALFNATKGENKKGLETECDIERLLDLANNSIINAGMTVKELQNQLKQFKKNLENATITELDFTQGENDNDNDNDNDDKDTITVDDKKEIVKAVKDSKLYNDLVSQVITYLMNNSQLLVTCKSIKLEFTPEN